jgi:Ca2+-binding EF-hand superfamily protein
METSVTSGSIPSEDHHSFDWVFNHLDKNGDGQVSREEFMEMAPTILKEIVFVTDVNAAGGAPPQMKM